MFEDENLQPGEISAAFKSWAKSEKGTYPPRPGNLLEIIQYERKRAISARRWQAWRDEGRPVVLDGVIVSLDAEQAEERQAVAELGELAGEVIDINRKRLQALMQTVER